MAKKILMRFSKHETECKFPGCWNETVGPEYPDYCPDHQVRTEPAHCLHPEVSALPLPEFDETAATIEGLTSSEVRKRWPRDHVICPECGAGVIRYASYAHYIWGDW